MHGVHIVILAHDTTPNSSKLFHVSTDLQEVTQVDTKGSDVCSGFAAHPENSEVSLWVVVV